MLRSSLIFFAFFATFPAFAEKSCSIAGVKAFFPVSGNPVSCLNNALHFAPYVFDHFFVADGQLYKQLSPPMRVLYIEGDLAYVVRPNASEPLGVKFQINE